MRDMGHGTYSGAGHGPAQDSGFRIQEPGARSQDGYNVRSLPTFYIHTSVKGGLIDRLVDCLSLQYSKCPCRMTQFWGEKGV